jgi:hypothetical protein
MAKSARVLGTVAIAVASVLMMMVPAGASSVRVSAHHGRAAAAPNSDLSGKGATAKFTPKALTATVFTAKQCNKVTPPTSFTLTNATRHSYDITYNGGVVFTVAKKTIESVCVSGKAGTIKIGISGSQHVLKVTLVKPA